MVKKLSDKTGLNKFEEIMDLIKEYPLKNPVKVLVKYSPWERFYLI
ncbi:MAG: hypothetical protein KC516_02280 [Nanoarchaeota archaeon]|nr:hypothetical protein [Nanoarchaeota archaeon]